MADLMLKCFLNGLDFQMSVLLLWCIFKLVKKERKITDPKLAKALADALESLRVKVGGTFGELAKRIRVSRSLIHTYVKGKSQPTLSTAVKLALLEVELTGADRELTCRRWIELTGRKTPSADQLRGMVTPSSPLANSDFQRELESLLAPLFKLGSELPPQHFKDLVLARVSQAVALERWIQWQRDNPRGTVMAFWDYEEAKKFNLKVFNEDFFKETLMKLLAPATELRADWPNKSEVDVDVAVCLTVGDGDKNADKIVKIKAEVAKAAGDFVNSNPDLKFVLNRFSIWGNSLLTQDNADRWIFFGVGSKRGCLLESVAKLGEWVPQSSLKSLGEKLPNWMYAAVEMPDEQVRRFLKTHHITDLKAKLQPDTSSGWWKIFPEETKTVST